MSEKCLLSTVLLNLKELNSPEEPYFFRDYLNRFLETAPARLEEMRANLKKPKDLAKIAHAFNSSCLNIGAHFMSAKLYAIENLAKTEDSAPAESLVNDCATEFERVKLELSEWIHSTN